MRVVAFFQVVLLLLLLVYLLLVALENPQLVRLPLPFAAGDVLLSVGSAVGIFALLGGAYVAFLLFPPFLRHIWEHQKSKQLLLQLEQKLAKILQARLVTTNKLQQGNGDEDNEKVDQLSGDRVESHRAENQSKVANS